MDQESEEESCETVDELSSHVDGHSPAALSVGVLSCARRFRSTIPYGEWPPSPWRLIRALIARSHQFAREEPSFGRDDLAALVRAFCTSSIRWHLPGAVVAWSGFAAVSTCSFSRVPKSAKEPGRMAYCTTKNLDNCWLTAGSENSVWWFIDGEQWTDAALRLLDACLARLTYFGRAESVTFVWRSNGEMQHPDPNCCVTEQRRARTVPVLFPTTDATLAIEDHGITKLRRFLNSIGAATRVTAAVHSPPRANP